MITICNYESYQAVKNKKDTAETQQGHTTDTAEAQQGHTTDTAEAHTIEYIDNREKENEEIKDSFLKNGKAAEKKVFKIEEIKAALAAEGIYMTENGYVEFKALNEGENGYGYKGGIIRSAQNFLQKPMNKKYSLARENNGNGKGKGKNTPPTPPQPPQASTDKQLLAVWENVKNAFREQMSLMDYKYYIENNAQCYPIKYENGIMYMFYGTTQNCQTFFYLHRDWIDNVTKATGARIQLCSDTFKY
ncbi:MAG: hypothetical protein II165_10635 [Bacteroidales bacterium]|nr:hypothetical protein [Bacteroidales bacterium]